MVPKFIYSDGKGIVFRKRQAGRHGGLPLSCALLLFIERVVSFSGSHRLHGPERMGPCVVTFSTDCQVPPMFIWSASSIRKRPNLFFPAPLSDVELLVCPNSLQLASEISLFAYFQKYSSVFVVWPFDVLSVPPPTEK